MTRTMYDGVDPAEVPSGAQLYAGYTDGRWPSYQGLSAKYPHALHVAVCVTADDDARCLDVETGDATPEQAPGWVARQRAGGQAHPWVYMDGSSWGAVKAAFAAQGVAPPLYWVASYVDDPSKPPAIPAGAIAIQYYDYGGYDASVVADSIPGLDPAPKPAAPAAEEDEMNTTSVNGRAGLSWAGGTRHVVQVTYDPAPGNPVLRVVLALTTGPLVLALKPVNGSGNLEIPAEHIAACRGVIFELEPGSPNVVYDACAV